MKVSVKSKGDKHRHLKTLPVIMQFTWDPCANRKHKAGTNEGRPHRLVKSRRSHREKPEHGLPGRLKRKPSHRAEETGPNVEQYSQTIYRSVSREREACRDFAGALLHQVKEKAIEQ